MIWRVSEECGVPGGNAPDGASPTRDGALVGQVVSAVVREVQGFEWRLVAGAGVIDRDAEGDAAVLSGIVWTLDEPVEVGGAVWEVVAEEDGAGDGRAIGHGVV